MTDIWVDEPVPEKDPEPIPPAVQEEISGHMRSYAINQRDVQWLQLVSFGIWGGLLVGVAATLGVQWALAMWK